MTTMLFIHGTGVRAEGIDAYFDAVRAGVGRIRKSMPVLACRWGDEVGATLLADGVSIPGRHERREPPQPRRASPPDGANLPGTEPEREVALWEALDAAPLLELQVLASQHPIPSAASSPSGRAMADRLGRAVGAGTPLHRALLATGLEHVAEAAATQLVASDEFNQVVDSELLPQQDKAQVLARAFTALLLGLRDEQLGCPTPLDGTHRQHLELSTAAALGQGPTQPEDAAASLPDAVLDSALWLATWWAYRDRQRWSAAMVPGLGDVLKYLVHGQALREVILRDVKAIDDREVILLGHSLGAVAAMDLLLRGELPQVSSLIAVASQSGLLYEFDALPGRRFDPAEQLPDDFPDTHFVHDPMDPLAYLAGGLFGDKVHDHVVDNHAPFPRNHGAYFTNPEFYRLLDRLLP